MRDPTIGSSMSDQLAHFAAARGLLVPRTFPIVQIVARITPPDGLSVVEAAGRAKASILQWVQAKCPRQIPENDLRNGVFDIEDVSGHRFEGISISGEADLWAGIVEHPDNDGRIWTVEASIGVKGSYAVFGTRMACTKLGLAASPFEPTTPRFVREIARSVGLTDSLQMQPEKHVVSSAADLEWLEESIRDSKRSLPIIVVSGKDTPTSASGPWAVDVNSLARATLGLAHIVVLPYAAAKEWTDRVGRPWSVYNGAIRTYKAHADLDEGDPSNHPFAPLQTIMEWEYGDSRGSAAFSQYLTHAMYRQSVTSPGWRDRFVEFRQVKTKWFERRRSEASFDQELQQLYELEIAELKKARDEARSDSDLYAQHFADTERDLEELRRNYHSLRQQNEALRLALRGVGRSDEGSIDIPEALDVLPDWIDEHLAARVVLHPRALKGLKNADYSDVPLVYNTLLLLANEYREMKIKGGADAKRAFDRRREELRLEPISAPISKTRAGEEGDEYYVRYPNNSGAKRFLESHLKKGTSRKTSEAFRIYFFWDEENKVVVIGWLPSHLDTRIT